MMAGGQITVGKQDEKQVARRPGTFVKGDSRINRTIPGPGRPPLWWKQALATREQSAIDLIGSVIDEGLRRLKPCRGKRGEPMQQVKHVHLAAAQDVLDRLHGRPTQSVEVMPPVDMSHLTDKEVHDLNRLLARVHQGDGTRGPQLRE